MNRKMLLGVFCVMVLCWCCRIYFVNQMKSNDYQIQMGEEIQKEEIRIEPLAAHLFTEQEFCENFCFKEEDLPENYYEDNDRKLICVCLEVYNTSGQDISWDLVMENTVCGFETKTWATTNDSYIESQLNVFRDECLRAGKKQKIWYAAEVNQICFKEETWKQLRTSDFEYILSLGSEKISVCLE